MFLAKPEDILCFSIAGIQKNSVLEAGRYLAGYSKRAL